jgi:hypothetical protein
MILVVLTMLLNGNWKASNGFGMWWDVRFCLLVAICGRFLVSIKAYRVDLFFWDQQYMNLVFMILESIEWKHNQLEIFLSNCFTSDHQDMDIAGWYILYLYLFHQETWHITALHDEFVQIHPCFVFASITPACVWAPHWPLKFFFRERGSLDSFLVWALDRLLGLLLDLVLMLLCIFFFLGLVNLWFFWVKHCIPNSNW